MAKNPSIRLPFNHELSESLVECMNECADDIRQLHTEFGGRAYSVSLVWLRWSADVDGDGLIQGDEVFIDDNTIGAGRATLIAEIPLLPVPEVSGLGAVGEDIDVTGNTERGGVTVSQISPGYSEDLLRGLLPDLVNPDRPSELQDGVQFFYEIQELRRRGHINQGTAACDLGPMPRDPIRRKFILTSTPERDPYAFQWVVALQRADGERKRDGSVEGIL